MTGMALSLGIQKCTLAGPESSRGGMVHRWPSQPNVLSWLLGVSAGQPLV
jgi:hypothetical protein